MIYLHLFTMFFRIGLFGFGGGMAMLPLIFQSVQEFGVMTASEFSNLVALSQVTPGPMAVNAATYVGFNFAGIGGAAIATIGVCLPSFVLMVIIFRFIQKFNESRIVQGILFGIKPVTIGLIGAAVVYVSETVLINGPLISSKLFTEGFDYFNLMPIGIFVVSLVLVGVFKMKPIRLMILMGIAGVLICG